MSRFKTQDSELKTDVVSVFTYQANGDEILSGGEEEAFICDTPRKVLGATVPNREGRVRRCDTLKRQMGDTGVICDNGAFCHMTYSSTGMINDQLPRSENVQRTDHDARCPIGGYGDLPLTFRSSEGGRYAAASCGA